MHGSQSGKGRQASEDPDVRMEKKSRIICVGSRLVESDAIGPHVHDFLARRSLPENVSLMDGGLAGLDLLRYLEGVDCVVFVDSLVGFAPPGCPVVLDHGAAMEEMPAGYAHDGGLSWLLRLLPAVCENDLPEIAIVGAEWPVKPEVVEQLAETALNIATGDRYGREFETRLRVVQSGTA